MGRVREYPGKGGKVTIMMLSLLFEQSLKERRKKSNLDCTALLLFVSQTNGQVFYAASQRGSGLTCSTYCYSFSKERYTIKHIELYSVLNGADVAKVKRRKRR